ncbi:hypothetical protein PMZ80_001056 [Knufia obscura]|uniref:F-box domain-containing protein n=2 Tax=Knufia TaxID=430999 RepID=A0AAN8I811_9EURO|nr:hypothetical protein PMZ80_001056 [Knufia obscura]KAK5958877.1 hypothetical protein OHC33_000721 [Knufia fluminis]
MPHIADLPPELLRAIIKQLSGSEVSESDPTVFSIMRVNKLWCQVTLELLLNRKLPPLQYSPIIMWQAVGKAMEALEVVYRHAQEMQILSEQREALNRGGK